MCGLSSLLVVLRFGGQVNHEEITAIDAIFVVPSAGRWTFMRCMSEKFQKMVIRVTACESDESEFADWQLSLWETIEGKHNSSGE